MKPLHIALLGASALAIGLGVWTWTNRTDEVLILSEVTPDLGAGQALYAENCAACHGVDLEGQDNWQSQGADGRLPAPPHDDTGHTWHHADTLLFEYTKLGGEALMAQQGMDFNSGMPGFGDQLTDQEIWNVLAYIKSTWPTRIIDIQSERSNIEN